MAFYGFHLVLQYFFTLYSLDELIHSLVFNNQYIILMTPKYKAPIKTLYWTYWIMYFNCLIYISIWMNVHMTFYSINLNSFSVSWNSTSDRILGIFSFISWPIIKFCHLYLLNVIHYAFTATTLISLGPHNFFLDFSCSRSFPNWA